jgi:hypothetical protein
MLTKKSMVTSPTEQHNTLKKTKKKTRKQMFGLQISRRSCKKINKKFNFVKIYLVLNIDLVRPFVIPCISNQHIISLSLSLSISLSLFLSFSLSLSLSLSPRLKKQNKTTRIGKTENRSV